ncbi:MAG: hypothetical protein ACKPCM_05490 [Pseudanabaena sp.]
MLLATYQIVLSLQLVIAKQMEVMRFGRSWQVLRRLDGLTSLRLTGKGRVWGRIDEGVMDLIWWDAEHWICKCLKRV